MSNIAAAKDDILQAEREAVKLFLISVEQEFNMAFSPSFSSSVDFSGRLPQLRIRENGEI